MHRLVQAPDGRLLDAAGWIDERELCRRYSVARVTLSPPGGEELAYVLGLDDDEVGIVPELFDAMLALRTFDWAPFGEPEFMSMAARPVVGADEPPTAEAGRQPD